VIAFALVNGPLPKAGVIIAAALVAVAVLAPRARQRAVAMLVLLILAPVLLLAEEWNSHRLAPLHHHPLEGVAAVVLGLALIVALAIPIARRPWLMAPLMVLTLPVRIPITLGGTTSNLLIPLYVVLASGTLAYAASTLGFPRRWQRGEERYTPLGGDPRAAVWLERLLVAYVLVYAIQAAYSLDFQQALQQVVFFYVPLSLGFCLLRRLRWTGELVRMCLLVAVGLAVLFSLVGFAEYATRSLLLNSKLVATNQNHAYFAVNSVFYDSNIFGRFLAMVMVVLSVTLLYDRRWREQVAAVGALAVLWVASVLSLSRSSLGALLAGLVVLAAIRWRISRAVVVTVGVLAVAGAAVAASPHTFGLEQGANGVSSGRGSLVSGGLHMFGQRPIWGYGSGSFQTEYLRQHPSCTEFRTTDCSPGGVGASHTLPVTIAAEQGVIGVLLYLGLLVAAALTLVPGVRRNPVRAAVLAAFVGLVLHTLVYDDFLSDPISWTLLAMGVSLARAPRTQVAEEKAPRLRPEALPA
jgi:putative inorganic carbon (HCO3(-)) transporter